MNGQFVISLAVGNVTENDTELLREVITMRPGGDEEYVGLATAASNGYDPAAFRLTRTADGLTTYTTRSLDGQPLTDYLEGCDTFVTRRIRPVS